MYHPVHIDGRSVVVLRKRGLGYLVVKSGWLEFDGKELTLATSDGSVSFSDDEKNALKKWWRTIEFRNARDLISFCSNDTTREPPTVRDLKKILHPAVLRQSALRLPPAFDCRFASNVFAFSGSMRS
jgi:hypothetical protein